MLGATDRLVETVKRTPAHLTDEQIEDNLYDIINNTVTTTSN